MKPSLDCLMELMNPVPFRPCRAGVSGGADSVALLVMLSRKRGYNIEAIHVNHGIRGDAADQDEAFVREL